jgi:uncharacterized Rossmann fold enzyme
MADLLKNIFRSGPSTDRPAAPEVTEDLDAARQQIHALEERVADLEKSLKFRGFDINTLRYKDTLLDRTMESIFRILFGRTLQDFQGIHSGKRCFVVGNGPSLNQIDMTLLRDEITLGSNRAFLGFEKWGFVYDYWMVQDRILADQNADEFCEKLPDEVVKFIPYTILKHFNVAKLNNAVPVHMDYTKQCSFSNDPAGLHEGFTVTVGLLQIAAIMGFEKIYLVGVDHNYQIPDDNVNEDRKWSGQGLSNHFSEEYTNHSNGQVWEMPDIVKMTKAYDAAAKWAQENGIEILNATPNTKLESFPKVDFESLFPVAE